MKKFQGLLLAAMLMLTANGLMAQTYSELGLTFSRTRPAGSARILGMGGASVSLGGDYSSSFSNPAGLGMYNRSEFSITPGYFSTINNGSYMAGSSTLSTGNSDSRTSLNIPGIALIFSKPQDGEGGFIHGSFGISMTKINDFNNNLYYKGTNNTSSLIDYFINDANGLLPDSFVEDQNGNIGDYYNSVTGLAYRNYLIGEASILDPSFPNDQYFTDFDREVNPSAIQEESITTKGAQNQWNLSYGANFNDKFFLGAGLGIVSLKFQSHKVFNEDFIGQPINGYTLVEDLNIQGTGINFTIGGIVRPADGFQVGASISTPTRYNLTDTYSATMNSSWNSFDYYEDGSVILNNESGQTDVVQSGYNLTTPWKFSAGASYIFGKSGLISVDVEHLNYGGARYNSQTDGISFNSDNDDMKRTYASVTNLRAGGEYRLNKLRFRGGFNFMPDPYKSVQNDVNNSRMSVSGGLGFRSSKFFVDVAYINSWSKNTYRPYTIPEDIAPGPILDYKQTVQSVITTVGFIF
jgi:hypothetical protein